MGDQDRYIHLKTIFVIFIKRRLTSDLELVFKDDAGVKHLSNKFKERDLIKWNLDTVVRTNTSAKFTIRQTLFNIRLAKIEIDFKPNAFGDYRTVGLEDSNHRVTVNLVCGSSKSLADVTRFIGPRASTDLALRFLKLPMLVAIPPPTSERGYDILYAAIHWLNDDILLSVFNCYRLDNPYTWDCTVGWFKLSHVCRRWRHLIYDSAPHLGVQIRCAYGTPPLFMLDHVPPLPLVLEYDSTLQSKLWSQGAAGDLGIYDALRLRDRVRSISLRLPPWILHKCHELMDGRFPILEDLYIQIVADKTTSLTLPEAFMAPNLRHLALPGITLPGRLRVLTSTVSLVTLALSDIQAYSYLRPRLLVARLRSLPQLEKLSLEFSIPIHNRSTERELLGEQETPVTLSNLKKLQFKGVSAYLESLIAQIRVPLLELLDITLLNRIVFSLPHLSHLINTTERFKPCVAFFGFRFSHRKVVATFAHWNNLYHRPRFSDGSDFLYMTCKKLDCVAKICSGFIPTLSSVELCMLYSSHPHGLPTEWKYGATDGTSWHKLLRSFNGVKELHIYDAFLKELSRALQQDEVGSDPRFLPDLQAIAATDNLFASFIDTRRVVGRPVQLSQPPAATREEVIEALNRISQAA